jgi:hypothetical protein
MRLGNLGHPHTRSRCGISLNRELTRRMHAQTATPTGASQIAGVRTIYPAMNGALEPSPQPYIMGPPFAACRMEERSSLATGTPIALVAALRRVNMQ